MRDKSHDPSTNQKKKGKIQTMANENVLTHQMQTREIAGGFRASISSVRVALMFKEAD